MHRMMDARDRVQLQDPPTIDELAHVVGTNAFRLKRDFKTVFGRSVRAFVLAERSGPWRWLFMMASLITRSVGVGSAVLRLMTKAAPRSTWLATFSSSSGYRRAHRCSAAIGKLTTNVRCRVGSPGWYVLPACRRRRQRAARRRGVRPRRSG